MPKPHAPHIPEDFDFAKNYLELKKLRDEIATIEKSRAGQVARSDKDGPDFDQRYRSRRS